MQSEFREIGHCGGKLTFQFEKDAEGQLLVALKWETSRPNPASLAGVYVLGNGVPVGPIRFGGIGDAWSPPPCSGCLPVLIGSDSEGVFGHLCPSCDEYWRGSPYPNVCPYCRSPIQMHECLSLAQQGYVSEYIERLAESQSDALQTLAPGESKDYEIDLDAVADSVSAEPKPDFYFSEESQQNKFKCERCSAVNDVIGRFAYCSVCAERNDLTEAKKRIEEIRESIRNGGDLPIAIKSSISVFDSFVDQAVTELLNFVPMTRRRRGMLQGKSFHNFSDVSESMKDALDIDLGAGLKGSDIELLVKFFHRRHVHEHRGGIVDQKYIDDSGDDTVRLRQELRENLGEVHQLLSLLTRVLSNLHDQFKEILPPLEKGRNAPTGA